MDTQTYTIYPPVKKAINMNSISITIFELKLFEYVKVACTLYDLDNTPQDTRIYIISGDDYKNWNNDDSYIVNYCKKQLQLEVSTNN